MPRSPAPYAEGPVPHGQPRRLVRARSARAPAGDGTALFFYGHDHGASDRQGRARYVNPGALGCHTAPLARFAILDVGDDGEYTVRHEAVPYDDGPLLRAFAERRVPERDFILRAFYGKSNPATDST